MLFISKYRNLRIILRITKKEVHETGGGKEVIVHPPVVCEFQNFRFDTKEMFPIMRARIDCCEYHKLKDEQQIINALTNHLEFGNSFNAAHELTAEEQINELERQLAELKEKKAEVSRQVQDETELDKEKIPQGGNDKSTPLEEKSYKELQAVAKEKNIPYVGVSRVELIKALSVSNSK